MSSNLHGNIKGETHEEQFKIATSKNVKFAEC